MDVLETILINGKHYISNIETTKEIYCIPTKTSSGENIYGIDSLAFINQPIKELTIPAEIKDIKDGAFVDCDLLETVYINSNFDNFIDLDNCFKKEIKNTLFLINNYEDCKVISKAYMKMKNFNLMENSSISYYEEGDTIYIQEFPNYITNIYIPDEYKGKKISLEKLGTADSTLSFVKKLRLPKDYTVDLKYFTMPSLEELCLSPKAKSLYVPKSSNLKKIICYENLEKVIACENLENLEYFTIGASALNLKTFKFPYEKTKWFKNIKENKNREIIIDGILFKYNNNKFLEEYKFDKDVLFAIDGLFFQNENIKKVIFNKSMKNISRDLFKCCKNLKKVIIPENIQYIGPRAFFEEEDYWEKNQKYSKEIIFEGNKDDIEIEEAAFDLSIDLPFY